MMLNWHVQRSLTSFGWVFLSKMFKNTYSYEQNKYNHKTREIIVFSDII